MEFKLYDTLPAAARDIRSAVFTDEQGFKEEFDEIDHCAKHLVFFDGGVGAAVCRIFAGDKPDEYIIGRIAVIKSRRKKGFGAKILRAAETEAARMGGKKAVLHAQENAAEFYKKQGYTETDKRDFDEGCPHVWMYKKLTNNDSHIKKALQ